MDILTEALESMRTGRPASIRTDGRAPWGLRLPPVAGAGFHVVLYGTCWLIPLGSAQHEPIALNPGDVVFLRDGHGHILADDPATPAGELLPEQFCEGSPIGSISVGGDGDGACTSLLCGNYHLDGGRRHPLVQQLPEVVHLRARAGRHAELNAAVQLLCTELENPRVGADGIVPALIDSLLLYILRAWLDEQPAAAEGWAAALNDAAVAKALAAIHDNPSNQWTVESLAARAGLSRAAFARRFTTMVGEPPLGYLTHWRMTTAAKMLRDSDAPLSTVATRTGYGSEFAFAKAFKREYGMPPGGYRRQARAA